MIPVNQIGSLQRRGNVGQRSRRSFSPVRGRSNGAKSHPLHGSLTMKRPGSGPGPGLPPMSRIGQANEPHTDTSEQQRLFSASKNPMTHYSNDITSKSHKNALKKQGLYARTSSAPVGGNIAATRGGIISMSGLNARKLPKKHKGWGRKKGSQQELFANGAHLSHRQAPDNSRKSDVLQQINSIKKSLKSSGSSLGSKKEKRPPSAASVLAKSSTNSGTFSHMSLEERQRVNSRRPNTAPTAPVSPTIQQKHADLTKENERLHQEMASMRDSFFRKMRGGKRFVSGGGFRTGNHPQHDTDRMQKNRSTGNDKNLKNAIRQLQNDKRRLQESLDDAQLQLRRLSEQVRVCKASAKSSDDMVKKLKEVIKEKEETIKAQDSNLIEMCKKYEALESKCGDQGREIDALKTALKALEDAQQGDAPLPPSPVRIVEPDPETAAALAKAEQKIMILEKRLQVLGSGESDLKKQIVYEREEKEKAQLLLKDSKKVQAILERQAKENVEKISSCESTIGQQKGEISELVKWRTVTVEKMKEKDETIKNLTEELAFLQKEFDMHKEQSSGAHGEMERSLREEIETLKKELARVKDLLKKQRDSTELLKKEKDRLQGLAIELEKKWTSEKEDKEVCQQQLREASEEIDRLRKELNALKIELDQRRRSEKENKGSQEQLLEKIEKYKNMIEKLKDEVSNAKRRGRNADDALSKEQVSHSATSDNLKRSQIDTKTEKKRADDLQKQLDEANKMLSGVEGAIEKAKLDGKKEAMEKTLQSMVRLCVVAPTVNVHFNNQQASCKAPMPSSRIQNIIQNDVLPNFTSLFLQMEEGVAENGSRLDAWLEEMLEEMQKSIQAHLHDVFSEQSSGNQTQQSGRPSSRSSGRRPSSRGISR
jgi:DNA repair exonuclease SbcCD ATPase subunit